MLTSNVKQELFLRLNNWLPAYNYCFPEENVLKSYK